MEERIDRVQEPIVTALMMIITEMGLTSGICIGMVRDMGVGIPMNSMREIPIKMTTTEVVVMTITNLVQQVGVLIDIQTIPLEMMITNRLGLLSFWLALYFLIYYVCL